MPTSPELLSVFLCGSLFGATVTALFWVQNKRAIRDYVKSLLERAKRTHYAEGYQDGAQSKRARLTTNGGK